MNIRDQRAAAAKAAKDIVDAAKAEGRDLTADEIRKVDGHLGTVKDCDAKIKAAAESDALMAKMTAFGGSGEGDREAAGARTLGEHFVKSVGAEGLARVKTISGATIAAPEYKAATDTHATPGSIAPWLTDFDRTIVRTYRRPVVSDLFGGGTITGNAVTYLVEGAVEGSFSTVAEGGAKPQLHIANPTTRTDALKKIAGFLKFTDEMVEDADFWVSEINQRGLYLLALAEEDQLLNGPGTGSTVEGLLNRSGVQTETAANRDDNADALFRAMTKAQNVSGLAADGIVINPTDYQQLRLSRDANGQYFGGGFFFGQYGNGSIAPLNEPVISGLQQQPPLWGLRTVVSFAVPAGTAIVGAFGTAATVYRKGGVRVESTNSHVDDFTNNLITTRIEERVALAVRLPTAFVRVTLSNVAPV